MSRLHAILVILACAGSGFAQTKDDLAAAAQKVLRTHCYVCHGQDGKAEFGVYVLNSDKLIADGIVAPGKPNESTLYDKMMSKKMPPEEYDGAKYRGTRPNDDEIATVRKWIEAGAPKFPDTAPKREFVSNEMILGIILADLQKADERHRKFYRYFTLTHLANAGKSDDELQSYRDGLSKLVNSLSWNSKIKIPTTVDPGKTIMRIDLRDLDWSAATWNEILKLNPYGVTYPKSTTAQACYKHTQCPLPYVRGDWFVFAASKPPLYETILELPDNVSKLEEKLRIDRRQNIADDRVARAGFNGSGVSKNNRLIERHQSSLTGGAYWISYDFATRVGKQNLFEHPLDFKQDGGEVIFNLPNGLQAYLLIDAVGKKIPQGPIKIVSDPDQPDRTVTNGISCMKCHADGMRLKSDQVRDAVAAAVKANSAAFGEAELKTVRAIYVAKNEFDDYLKEDAKRFQDAVKKTGSQLSRTEPIFILARQFDAELDLATTAAEAGARPDEFVTALGRSAALAKVFAPLLEKGGTVGREVFVAAFGDIVKELERDAIFAIGEPKAGEVRKFEIASGVFMEFCWVPPGEAQLGSPKEEQDYLTKTFLDGKREKFLDEEKESYRGKKKFTGFWLGKYTVTQKEWESVMGSNPSYFQPGGKGNDKLKKDGVTDTSRFAVEEVSWNDCHDFLEKINKRDGIDKVFGKGASFKLPHEDQWEYACRGGLGNKQPFYFGNELNGTQANCDGNYPYGTDTKGQDLERTCAVDFTNGGKYEKHPWGLFHMAGNVYQWCENKYSDGGSGRVYRGGGWGSYAGICRSAYRDGYAPEVRFDLLGFRAALVPSGP